MERPREAAPQRDPNPGFAVRTIATLVGDLALVASAQGIREVRWEREDANDYPSPSAEALAHAERAADQLRDYFRGRRQAFDLPLDLAGTDFQRLVWRALTDIPFGETRAYGALADAIGRPRAARAVGAATGQNPAPIIVPCHRVTGANGALTGFAGGLERKRLLLAHEADARGSGTRLPGF